MPLQQINDREYNDCDGGPITTEIEEKKKKGNELTKLWMVQRPTESNALSIAGKKGNNQQQY